METRELLRIADLDSEIDSLMRQYRAISDYWTSIDLQRKEMDRQIKALVAERDALMQGQMIFPVAS